MTGPRRAGAVNGIVTSTDRKGEAATGEAAPPIQTVLAFGRPWGPRTAGKVMGYWRRTSGTAVAKVPGCPGVISGGGRPGPVADDRTPGELGIGPDQQVRRADPPAAAPDLAGVPETRPAGAHLPTEAMCQKADWLAETTELPTTAPPTTELPRPSYPPCRPPPRRPPCRRPPVRPPSRSRSGCAGGVGSTAATWRPAGSPSWCSAAP